MSDREPDPAISQIEADLHKARFEESETEAFLSRRAKMRMYQASARNLWEKINPPPLDQETIRRRRRVGLIALGLYVIIAVIIGLIANS